MQINHRHCTILHNLTLRLYQAEALNLSFGLWRNRTVKEGDPVSIIQPSLSRHEGKHRGGMSFKQYMRRYGTLYIMLLLPIAFFLIFRYAPMAYILSAFKKNNIIKPPWEVAWAKNHGFEWFIKAFNDRDFHYALRNTITLNLLDLFIGFPAPILLALLLNEMRSLRYKKVLQTFLYVPHFISIVIVVSITMTMFNPGGIVYRVTEMILGKPINYMGSPDTFRWMIIGQSIWKETGWGTIIFLAALTNVDTQLYEAAMVDGAGRLRRLWHITLPAIRSTIVLMLILRMGSMLDTGHDHLILMANSLNRSASQTLDVFVYQQGIANSNANPSYASAIGLMKSIVSVTLVVSSNKIAHALGESGLY